MNHQNAKRLAILTGNDLAHRYVSNRLSESLPIHTIFVDTHVANSSLKRIWKKSPILFLNKAARMVYLKLIKDKTRRIDTLKNCLGNKCLDFLEPAKIVYVKGINRADTQIAISKAKPTSLLVYGTTIVKPPTLNIASEISFNMHTGISPEYRGTACSFWPIVNNEFNMLGSTVHECTNDLDGGAIFEIVRSTYENTDNLYTIFGKNVRLGADAYIRVVQRYLNAQLSGNIQDLHIGNEYKGTDLTLFPEIKARYNLLTKRLSYQ